MKAKSLKRPLQGFLRDLNNMQTFVILSSTTLSFAICLSVFICIIHRSGIAVAENTDSQETCDTDCESNTTDNVSNMKCFVCTSKNGIVECIKPKCPSVEGCYLLRDLQKDECCQKCKGCMKNDTYHESGTEWIESSDPCRLYTCIAGVITESTIRCYTPCDNPIPPTLGQCCPTCPDCKVKNKRIIGETRIMPNEDPCISCNCTSGLLTCTKKTCPVLNCPKSKIVQDSAECCPQCLGTGRYLDPPKGACLLGNSLHQSGKKFTIDDCTDCRCQNSTVHCKRESCPILRCERNMQETVPGRCCPQCKNVNTYANDELDEDLEDTDSNEDTIEDVEDKTKKPKLLNESSCTYEDETYKHGESWNTTGCTTCNCKKGKVTCSAVTCPAINCPSNSNLKVPEGQCCPVCVEREGVCTVFGGSHFRTFDGNLYAFIGSCKYQLASDCDSGTFNIRLKNIISGNDATIKRISLKLGDTRIDFQQNKNTKVNDRIIDLPYRLKNKLEITKENENVILTSNIGIKILWNYIGFLEITVPRNYRKKLCGLCGNFNSLANDDMTTREGIMVEDPAVFAQSWISGDELCLDTRKYEIRGCNPQKDERLCSYIKGSAFEKCLKKINVTSYYETCMKDMCQCSPDDLQCHCESFSSYVRDCRRLGILLPRWRKSVGC